MPHMQTLPTIRKSGVWAGVLPPTSVPSLGEGVFSSHPALCDFILDKSLLVLTLNDSWPAVRYAAKQSSSYAFTMFFREG